MKLLVGKIQFAVAKCEYQRDYIQYDSPLLAEALDTLVPLLSPHILRPSAIKKKFRLQ